MTEFGLITISRLKSLECRALFGDIVVKFRGRMSGAALDKRNLILLFLMQSEQSYIIREHELKKLAKEPEGACG
jgi:hypothetical protein